MAGKLYLSKWLTYGDEFHLKKETLLQMEIPFNEFNLEERNTLDKLYKEFSEKLPSTIQFKLNAGKKIGSFSTRKLWNITDQSDSIFLRHLTDNPIKVFEAIENHIASSVISVRHEENEED